MVRAKPSWLRRWLPSCARTSRVVCCRSTLQRPSTTPIWWPTGSARAGRSVSPTLRSPRSVAATALTSRREMFATSKEQVSPCSIHGQRCAECRNCADARLKQCEAAERCPESVVLDDVGEAGAGEHAGELAAGERGRAGAAVD